jgi:MoaA/NifB/PqqE/SkfB family radical SAM enzyme
MENKLKVRKLKAILEPSKDDNYSMYDAAKKAIFHKENFSAFLQHKYYDVKPVSVEIVPSLDCNLNCANCTYKQNKSKQKNKGKKRLMSMEVYNLIIESLKELDAKSIIFTGGGEPVMNPLWLEFIRQAKNKGFDIGLYTNGSLLRKKDIKQLLEINPTFIRVSLNAGTPKTHSDMCGYSQKESKIFKRITENIITLGKIKRKLNTPTTIGIGYIMSEKNHKELDEISDLLISMQKESGEGIDYVAFRPEVYYFDKNLDVITKQPNAKIFAGISKRLEKIVRKKVNPNKMAVLINEEGFKQLSQPYKNIPNIANPWSTSFDYDGRVYITSERNGMKGFSIGDIKLATLKEIWNGSRRKELIRKMEYGKIKALQNYKLKSLNGLLREIKNLGAFSKKEIKEFYENIDLNNKPPHVNFV